MFLYIIGFMFLYFRYRSSVTKVTVLFFFLTNYSQFWQEIQIKVVDLNYILLLGEVQFLSMMGHFWKMGQCNSNLGV